LVVIPACFNPTYDHPTCGPNGACPSGLTCNAQQICERASLNDPNVDAQTCVGTGLVRICLQTPPTAPLTISTSTIIDTDSSSMCAPIASGGNYCVLAATTISVEALLRATGSRPLVLVARDSIAVSNTIDVGSHRGVTPETGAGADPATCAAGTSPGTSGGGAGGTFAGTGGTGGNSDSNAGGTPALVTALTELQGGCAGQDGQGAAKGVKGHGGGAVFLLAGNTIDVGGGINAAGEGGSGGANTDSGGGGGGAGGMIGFDAPMITGRGLILANGGGGGGGSGGANPGGAGSDPSSITAAPGGNGAVAGGGPVGGDGGAGSAGLPAGPGVNGANDPTNETGGAGGGGGGAGLVKAPATANLGTQVSPPASP
jgi:hypothetical protein